jgi:hypothetical protein
MNRGGQVNRFRAAGLAQNVFLSQALTGPKSFLSRLGDHYFGILKRPKLTERV